MHACGVIRNYPPWYDGTMNGNKNRLGSFSNFVGGIAYINVTIQWIWSSIPLLYPLAKNETFKTYFMPQEGIKTAPVEALSPALSSGIELLLLIAALLFSVGVIGYVIIAVPRSFGKAGKTVTTKSAQAIIPALTRHKKITKKQQRTLLSRISWSIKALLVVLPVFLLFITLPKELQLTQNQFFAAGSILAVGSSLLFLAQLGLAKIAKLPSDKTW